MSDQDRCIYCLGRRDTPEPACTCGDTAIDVLLRDGYRRCDSPACNCKSWHIPWPPYDGISITLKWGEDEKHGNYDLTLGPIKFAEITFSPGGNNWYVYMISDRNTYKYFGNYNDLEEAKERAEQWIREMS